MIELSLTPDGEAKIANLAERWGWTPEQVVTLFVAEGHRAHGGKARPPAIRGLTVPWLAVPVAAPVSPGADVTDLRTRLARPVPKGGGR